MICLSLTADLRTNLTALRNNAEFIDIAELRADFLVDPDSQTIAEFPRLVRAALGVDLPLILTVRLPEDGGRYSGSETKRLELLGHGIDAGFAYIDLERGVRDSQMGRDLAKRAREQGCTVIRSVHDTLKATRELTTLLHELSDDGREIPKVACTPGSVSDLADLIRAADQTAGLRKILIGMGEFGQPTRILSRRMGNFLTFVSDPDGQQAAPGHIGPAEMAQSYRLNQVDDKTSYFAVIGSPIAHSKSPAYHNRRFREDEVNAVYLPILVDDVDQFFELADLIPLRGVSVTIPHKEAVATRLTRADDSVTATGSCNTLLRHESGWRGLNTDVTGFSDPLLAVSSHPAGLGATVVGAGGASRAVVTALLQMGMRVMVLNRSPSRAESLVGEVLQTIGLNDQNANDQNGRDRITFGKLEPGANLSGYTDVIVQTTSVGMNGDGDPIPWFRFSGDEIVYDIVYTPPETPLVLRARAAGCTTVTGDLMFAAQADAQYREFRTLVGD